MNKNFEKDNYLYYKKFIDESKINEIYRLIKSIIDDKKCTYLSEVCIEYNINNFINFKNYIIKLLNKVLFDVYEKYYLIDNFNIYLNKLPKKNKDNKLIQVFISLTNSITKGSYIFFQKSIFDNKHMIEIKLNKGDIIIFKNNILYGGFNRVMSKPNILLEFYLSKI